MPRIMRHRRAKSVYFVAMEKFEKELISGYLERFDGYMPDVAGALGIALQTLYYRCKKLKIGRYATEKRA